MQPELLPQLSSRNIASDQLHSAAQMVPVPANMFNSGSKYLVRWKTLLLLLVAYDAFVLPFEWTFIRLDRYTHCARYINLFIDVMFGLDILVHFNTARLINGSWVTNRTQLAWRYIRTWFVVDILSAIPFEIIFRLHIRWIKFVRIFGLLRVVKFSRVAHSIQAHFKLSTSVYRVIRFVVMVIFGIHWCACVFWLLNRSQAQSDPKNLSEPIRSFIDSLLWSTSTIIPIGYGDVRPLTLGARLFGVAVMAFGVAIFTFAITKGVGLVQDLTDIEKRRFELKMDQVEELLDHLDLPDNLWDEIAFFFEYNHKTHLPTMCNEKSLIDDLSRQLRSDVISAVNEYKTSDAFVLDCVFAMQTQCFPPEADLSEWRNGSLCIVMDGTLMYEERIIGPGARFGCLSHPHHVHHLEGPSTITWCRISVLKREALIPILVKHRKVQRYLCGKEGLRLRPTITTPGQAAWVNEIVDLLSARECQALLLLVDGVRTRLQHQEILIRKVDRIFADDIARRPSSWSQLPSGRAAAFTMDAFSTRPASPAASSR